MKIKLLRLISVLSVLLLQGCDKPEVAQAPPISQPPRADAPPVESAPDPVVTLRQLTAGIHPDKSFQQPEGDWREWKRISGAEFGEELIQWQSSCKRYFNVESIDVKKTDSLVSPFLGIATLSQTRIGSDGHKESEVLRHRVQLAWQDGRWVPKSVETVDGYGAWQVQEDDFPETLLLKRLFVGGGR